MQYVNAEEKQRLDASSATCASRRSRSRSGSPPPPASATSPRTPSTSSPRTRTARSRRELVELEAKLADVAVVGDDEVPDDMIFLGHTVKLLDEDDDSEQLVRIVGEVDGAPRHERRRDARQRRQPAGRGPAQAPRRRPRQGRRPPRLPHVRGPRHPPLSPKPPAYHRAPRRRRSSVGRAAVL